MNLCQRKLSKRTLSEIVFHLHGYDTFMVMNLSLVLIYMLMYTLVCCWCSWYTIMLPISKYLVFHECHSRQVKENHIGLHTCITEPRNHWWTKWLNQYLHFAIVSTSCIQCTVMREAHFYCCLPRCSLHSTLHNSWIMNTCSSITSGYFVWMLKV